MMRSEEYLKLKRRITEAGYGEEIEWARNIKPCVQSVDFWEEYAWVVVSAGIRNQVARIVWRRIQDALVDGKPFLSAYRHEGKAAAIEKMWHEKDLIFKGYRRARDKLSFLVHLPWIGPVTKYHLAKNLGIDTCKPDRHLVRIAKGYGLTPEEICRKLSAETRDSVATVDTVIWRAANLGMV